MQATETKLKPIIQGDKQYFVPLFQRSYTWKKKDWETLWSDLLELYLADKPRTHFVGSIVTMPTNSAPEDITKYLLIDGQQRLTTIFILLVVLRDKAKINGNIRLAEEIENSLLVNQFGNGSDYYKLLLTQIQDDRTCFEQIIKAETFTQNHLIKEAYQFFERKLQRDNIDEKQLKNIVTGHLSIVSIVLDMEDNPHLVFESLNFKGVPLTPADLIRNYFLMQIPPNHQAEIFKNHWQPIQVALGDNLTEYVRHYLMKDGGDFVRQNDVYDVLRERVKRQGNTQVYLAELKRFARYYQRLLSPQEHEPQPDIRRMLARLNRIQVTVAYPFLLNCYDDYDQGKLPLAQFIEVLQALENFVIRRFICAVPTYGLNKIFPPLHTQAQKLNPDSFVQAIKKLLEIKNYPKDDQFRDRLTTTVLYGRGERETKTKLILESIEEFYGHKERVDFNALTIEHVMPQTLTENWEQHLGEFAEETHALLRHTLGNLTLTGDNSQLSNVDFKNKQRILNEKSHLELNRYFYNLASWQRHDIERRANYLADIALKIWPYFGQEQSSPNSKGVTHTTPKKLWVLGQSFEVKSWRDVMEQTLNTIAELEPEQFELLLTQFPAFVSRDKSRWSSEPRLLKNGVFINVQLSAQAIHLFCLRILDAVDLSSEDWQVET